MAMPEGHRAAPVAVRTRARPRLLSRLALLTSVGWLPSLLAVRPHASHPFSRIAEPTCPSLAPRASLFPLPGSGTCITKRALWVPVPTVPTQQIS